MIFWTVIREIPAMATTEEHSLWVNFLQALGQGSRPVGIAGTDHAALLHVFGPGQIYGPSDVNRHISILRSCRQPCRHFMRHSTSTCGE